MSQPFKVPRELSNWCPLLKCKPQIDPFLVSLELKRASQYKWPLAKQPGYTSANNQGAHNGGWS